jgi:WD40 repeat protein
MMTKKSLLTLFLSLTLIPLSYGMEAGSFDQEMTDRAIEENNGSIECLNSDGKKIFTFEMPLQTLALSQTLKNALDSSDEDAHTITITPSFHNFSSGALKMTLHLMKTISNNESKEESLIHLLVNTNEPKDLLQLAHAASYLSCDILEALILKSLIVGLRSSIVDIPSLTQALEIAQIVEGNYFFSLYSDKQAITYTPKTITEINEHTDRVSAVCYSPDRKTMASASWDQTIKLWDVETNECITTLEGHDGCILSIAFSPNGKTLVSSCDAPSVIVWDIETGEILQTFEDSDINNSVVFSPSDNNMIAFGAEKSLIIYPDYHHQDSFIAFNQHTDDITTVLFSPKNDCIASASNDMTITLLNTQDYKKYDLLEGHEANINTLCFSPKGDMLVSGDMNGIINVWDIAQKKCMHTIQGHTGSVNALALSDNNILFSTGDDNMIKLWDIDSGSLIQSFATNDEPLTLALSPDNLHLAVGFKNNIIMLYEFHNISKDFSLATLLLAEFLMQNTQEGIIPSEPFYCELFTRLPLTFQQQFAPAINQNAFILKTALRKHFQA